MTTKREIERPIMRTYSNLTKAITEGQRIDWEALDGRAGAVTSEQNEGATSLEFTFYRDTNYPANTPEGATESDMPAVFGDIISQAWKGEEGMTLWVEGALPLRPVMADTLPLGTCFLDMEGHPCFLFENEMGEKKARSFYANVSRPAQAVEVQGAYGVGTFRYDGQEEA